MFHLAFAATVFALPPLSNRAPHEDLVPCLGLYADLGAPDPYLLAVRTALLGGVAYRKCQLVAIPSFEAEWGVYMLRDEETPPTIVLRRLRNHLWYEMCLVLERASTDGSYSLADDAMSAAIGQLDVRVDELIAPVSDETADLLEGVWEGMLARVHYEKDEVVGYDGVNYHVAHWVPGSCRCGEAWSPDEGTRASSLVGLAVAMGVLAETPPATRRLKEIELDVTARALLDRLRALEEEERNR